MTLFEKASELGKLIADADIAKNLKETEALLVVDIKAKELIDAFQAAQKTMVDAVNAGKSKEETEALRADMTKKYEAMYDYEVTGNFFRARQEFDATMKQINDIIAFEITGESPSGCGGGGCGSGCGGCKS